VVLAPSWSLLHNIYFYGDFNFLEVTTLNRSFRKEYIKWFISWKCKLPKYKNFTKARLRAPNQNITNPSSCLHLLKLHHDFNLWKKFWSHWILHWIRLYAKFIRFLCSYCNVFVVKRQKGELAEINSKFPMYKPPVY